MLIGAFFAVVIFLLLVTIFLFYRFKLPHKCAVILMHFLENINLPVIYVWDNESKFNKSFSVEFPPLDSEEQWQALEHILEKDSFTSVNLKFRRFLEHKQDFVCTIFAKDGRYYQAQGITFKIINKYFKVLFIIPKHKTEDTKQANIDTNEISKYEQQISQLKYQNKEIKTFFKNIFNEVPIPIWFRSEEKVIMSNQEAKNINFEKYITEPYLSDGKGIDAQKWQLKEITSVNHMGYIGYGEKNSNVRSIVSMLPQNETKNNFFPLVNNFPFAVAIFSKDVRLLYSNEEFRKTWGLSLEDVSDYPSFIDLFYRIEDAGSLNLINKDAWLDNQLAMFNNKDKDYDSGSIDINMAYRTLTQQIIKSDNVSSWIIWDNTELADLRRDIKQETQVMQQTINYLPFAVIVVSDDGQIRSINNNFFKLWNIDKATYENHQKQHKSITISMLLEDINKQIDDKITAQEWRHILMADGNRVGDIRTNNGKYLSFYTNALPDQRRIIQWVDVSAQHQFVEANSAKEQALKHSITKVHQVMQDVAEDIKTPLTTLQSSAQILNSGYLGELNDRQKQQVEVIDKNVHELSETMLGSLTLAMIDAQKITINKDEADISTILNNVVNISQRKLHRLNINPSLSFLNEVKNLTIDADLCKKIIFALLNFALDYTTPSSTINIGVEHKSKEKQLLVDITFKNNDKNKLHFIKENERNIPKEAIIELELVEKLINLTGGDITFVNEKNMITIKLKLLDIEAATKSIPATLNQ